MTGKTLATEVESGGGGGSGGGFGGTTLGSGAFGQVGTYRYHGATVAVKELKAGADVESIGALDLGTGRAPAATKGRCGGVLSLCRRAWPRAKVFFFSAHQSSLGQHNVLVAFVVWCCTVVRLYAYFEPPGHCPKV